MTSQAFERRCPYTAPDGSYREGDRRGLSVGFADSECVDDFIERTRRNLSFRGVISLPATAVESQGLNAEPEENDGIYSKVKGNITGVPYKKETPEMTDDQRCCVDEARAIDIGNQLARVSTVVRQDRFDRIE